MARARNIKPAFFTNEDLAELDPLTRLAFVGLWTIANYRGCLENRPKRIKAQILPYDNCDIEKIMINLERSGFIARYSVNGAAYLKIMNFEKHQNPHPNEKKAGSDIPDIPESEAQVVESKRVVTNHEQDVTNRDKDGTSRADSLLLIPDSLQSDTLQNTMSGKPDPLLPISKEILEFLNEKTGRNYQPVKANISKIRARLKEGYTDTQVRQVIAKKAREWGENEKLEPYLRPKTLFGAENFANYVGELGQKPKETKHA